MSQIWISLSAYGGVTTEQALLVLWTAGVRQVELAIGVKPSSDTVEVLQQYQHQGMQYRAHHAIVWEESRSFNLAHPFDAAYFARLTDWLARMGISAYSVHAGRYARTTDPEFANACFWEHVGQLGEMCRDRGIRLGVETMYPASSEETHQYLLQNAIQVKQFLHDVPDVDLVVDMAHLNLWRSATVADQLQVLQLAPHRVLEIHISDNDGDRDTHTTISDRTWWLPYTAMFPAHVPIVLESRMNRQNAAQVRQQIEAVESRLCAGGSR